MSLLSGQARAILWAQWRSARNRLPRTGAGGLLLSGIMLLAWYGIWAAGGLLAAGLIAEVENPDVLLHYLPTGLLFVFLYWQVVPVLMASTGASIEFRKLLVYPIPRSQFFRIEVLLRLTTGIEVLIVLAGVAVGLWRNPLVPVWAPFLLAPYVLFNLYFAAGTRNLLMRLLNRRGVREIAVWVLVLAAALPQLLLLFGLPEPIRRFFSETSAGFWPWTLAARATLGQLGPAVLAGLALWVALAYAFGRRQFERSLESEIQAARAAGTPSPRRIALAERLYRLPSAFLADPAAALVEKDLRFLSRAPRFRLVFLMGFSFGLLIWLPLLFGTGELEASRFAANFLAIVSVYAMMLLGEVTFWNAFGLDRAAAQLYYVAPLDLRTLFRAKNVTASIVVFVNISSITAVCFLLRMPLTPGKVAEAYGVAGVLLIYLLAIGNLASAHFPRPIEPDNSWRSSGARKFQIMLLFLYPVLLIPIALAYLARYAFNTDLAFWLALAAAAAIAAVVYWVALDSAVAAARSRREKILEALAESGGPIAAS